jgi:hypothetical protein
VGRGRAGKRTGVAGPEPAAAAFDAELGAGGGRAANPLLGTEEPPPAVEGGPPLVAVYTSAVYTAPVMAGPVVVVRAAETVPDEV